ELCKPMHARCFCETHAFRKRLFETVRDSSMRRMSRLRNTEAIEGDDVGGWYNSLDDLHFSRNPRRGVTRHTAGAGPARRGGAPRSIRGARRSPESVPGARRAEPG